ncbi:hypothetical protein [Ruegeria sp. 6PALISEP08]|uniref:hypothetical protein n=1 Tax=Ruegeria sp. 6PALISEP08 TaxID=1225660 RepID=UPI00067E8EC0|nr:hypothetical protein [Ruegeria sp. 6PALISEP08]
MSKLNIDYDPIQSAIFQALSLAPSAHDALDQLVDCWTDIQSANAARRLAVRIAQEKIFSARDLDALECMLLPLIEVVDTGRRTEFISDENHVRGGYHIEELEPKARDLESKIQPLKSLLTTLQTLGRLRRSEQIALTLRGEDMT